MKNVSRSFWITFVIILGTTSLFCTRVKDVIDPLTETIFPLETGKYRISHVNHTTFNTSGPVYDRYYKKEETGNVENDLLGREVWTLQTYRSAEEFGTNYEFEIDRLWTQHRASPDASERFAERIEENKRFLVLKFPVYRGISWNGNLYNDLDTEIFRYIQTDTSVEVRGKLYENCVVVMQKLDTIDTIFSYRYAYEVFAPNIGRIKKFDRTYIRDGANGEFNPDKSFRYLEEIIEHNYED